MGYQVKISPKVSKSLQKLPEKVLDRLLALVERLKLKGPTGGAIFSNYSKLSDTRYHCHLTYRYVACWRHDKGTIIIEVYYAGTRENAPY